jgi:hypothetical protein
MDMVDEHSGIHKDTTESDEQEGRLLVVHEGMRGVVRHRDYEAGRHTPNRVGSPVVGTRLGVVVCIPLRHQHVDVVETVENGRLELAPLRHPWEMVDGPSMEVASLPLLVQS